MVGLNDPDPVAETASKNFRLGWTLEKLEEDTDAEAIDKGVEPGPSSSNSVIYTHAKITDTNGDAQRQYELTQITGNPKLSSDSADQVNFNGTVGEIIQVFDFTIPSEEADLRKKYTTLQPFLKTPTMGGSNKSPETDEHLIQMPDEEVRDKNLHDEVVKEDQLVSFQDVVAKLEEVEGYDSESWGSAVEISSSTFYPKKLTSAMSQEEFEQFINDDKELSQPSKLEETVLSNTQVESCEVQEIPISSSSNTMSRESNVELNGDLEHACNVVREDEYFAQSSVSMNTKQSQPSQEYLDYLDKDIMDIPDEEITSTFVLDFILRDVATSSVNRDKSNKKTPVVVEDTFGQEDISLEPLAGDEVYLKTTHNTSEEELTATSPISDDVEIDDHLNAMPEISPFVVSTEICGLQTETNTCHDRSEEAECEESREEPEPEIQAQETVKIEGGISNQSVESAQLVANDVMESYQDPDTFSIVDPRINRRTRSPTSDCTSSRMSVTSTSSSLSSIRPCSVRLTRLSISPSPSRTYQSSVNDKSIAEPSNQSDAEKSDETPITSGKPTETTLNDSATGVIKIERFVDEDELPLATIKANLKAAKVTKNNSIRKRNVRSTSVSSKSDDSLETVFKSFPSTEKEEPVKIFEPIPANVSRKTRRTKIEVKHNPDNDNTLQQLGASEIENNSFSASSRKRLANATCEVVAKKERIEKTDKQAEEPVSKMNKKRLISFIKQESKKDQPDFVRLSEAMSRTYEQRRKPIYDKGRVYLDDLKSFPELLHFQMVKEEYGRIKENLTKMKALEAEFISGGVLTTALEPVKKKTFKKEKKHKICEDALKLWQEKKPDPQYHKVLGILAVCFTFAENNLFKSLCKVLKKGESLSEYEIEQMQAPTIVVNEDDILDAEKNSEIWIYVDGAKFLEVPNIYEAVLTTFATYYLLNIDYPKSLKSLFEFFDMLNGNSQSTYNKTKKLFSLSE